MKNIVKAAIFSFALFAFSQSMHAMNKKKRNTTHQKDNEKANFSDKKYKNTTIADSNEEGQKINLDINKSHDDYFIKNHKIKIDSRSNKKINKEHVAFLQLLKKAQEAQDK
jgi:hypothetical protein